ncbi:Transcriptional regulator, LysR family OS=Tsukamurella paurometabola (strain ATCC 8368 / DSM/ CCUG 35730 / CIP 100753 / JCM 10117 / KCTC 9821 / NBRC 16120/ NCIMB 702349 / NCTC 13040) OX=521096 GN=Tpau_0641 PE=3 SV=1 [Tsukamurella paurometabola]|uniref:Transcriptional regulator, LysR family n=1 Tax=Tsukamurella paurometabola (strain ATCC 8368 / DSM 20162 / CCUG 35730 / CIP 100753 / JCM 10117 / KCTC 9821 / NBRC 16120 / NCIMB 702349 / NCTC 13040) TaxID=521096 RepID=D5USZ1_TSUPD|nr:LysR family transcriptional regulator [Tsukamurella paurometabola]ADG77278.1 transcriptional regulator, LysR family [Tsukamurella paurometabola DSM 20162]SUP43366.1 HTH-type transcriptional regulator gltC [Tsukamurella paurometabola]
MTAGDKAAASSADDLVRFITLAETAHMTDAAALLHISQPTLSRSLARMETDLGTPLFDRRHGRLVLNASGEIYLDHARRAHAELEAARAQIADLKNPSQGTIRLAFLHSFGVAMVPQLVSAFRACEPRVTFELSQFAAGTITDLVLADEADLAIVSPRPTTSAVAWQLLTVQRLALAVPSGHPLANRSSVHLSEASDADFITMHPEYGLRRILEERCAAAGFRPRIAFESSESFTVAGLVAAGLGVALLPMDRNPLLPSGLTLVPMAGPAPTREVGIIWRPDVALPRAVRSFRDHAIEQSDRPGEALTS